MVFTFGPEWCSASLRNAVQLGRNPHEKAASTFTLALKGDGTFSAQVQVRDRAGNAVGASKAATIAVAVARAIGLDVPDGVTEAKKR